MKFSSALSCICFIVLASSVGSSAELTQHLRSVTVASEDIRSAHDATIPDIPRDLKKKKVPKAKKTKAPKSTKKPKAPKSAKKPKSNKTLVTASPSPQPTEKLTSLQPSSSPTDDPCALISTVKAVLLSIKDGFSNGDSVLTNWASDTDPCADKWSGITCSDGEVTGIGFNEKGLSGTISPLIGCPTTLPASLTYLDFYSNSLTGSIPTEIGFFTSLTYLDFSYNSLSGSIPTEIGSFPSLSYLEFVENALTGTIPTEIGFLTSLDDLFFRSNNLTGTIPTEIGSLIKLTILNFSSNTLTGSIPSEIGSITILRSVDFSDNDLTGSMPAEICARVSTLKYDIGEVTGCV